MLIVSRKTQDHTHHTPAKLALLHSLSSNTLYTLPLASPTPLSPLQNCGKLWFLCGRRSLWCHHAVLCVKQTSLNGAHSAANLENPAKYGVDGSTACRLDSIRATPAQIFRARHHRVRSAEMELSWIIAHDSDQTKKSWTHLNGSDSAPSFGLDRGLFARGHPERDLGTRFGQT